MPSATRQRLIQAAIKRAIEEIICQIADRAGASDPSALAEELCLISEGAYVTRQVTGNRQTVDIARRVADRVLAGHAPQNGRTPAE